MHHRAMVDLFLSLLGALRSAFRSRASLALENLALRQQLANLRRTSGRPRLRKSDRVFWLPRPVLRQVVIRALTFPSVPGRIRWAGARRRPRASSHHARPVPEPARRPGPAVGSLAGGVKSCKQTCVWSD